MISENNIFIIMQQQAKSDIKNKQTKKKNKQTKIPKPIKTQKALLLVAVADLPTGQGQVTLLEACNEGTPPKSHTSGTTLVSVSKGIGVFLEGLFI